MESSIDTNFLVAINIQLVIWLLSVAAFLMMMEKGNGHKIPAHVIKEMIESNLGQFVPVTLLRLLGKKYKRASISDVEEELDVGVNKKSRTMIKYNRIRAYECVMKIG
jgi:uncharacterized membrane protein